MEINEQILTWQTYILNHKVRQDGISWLKINGIGESVLSGLF